MKFSFWVALILAGSSGAHAQSLSGLWDATVKFDDFTVPFPIKFSQNRTDVAASFFNGDERATSTSGKLTGDTVTVNFDHFATKLTAVLANGELKGTYGGKRNGVHEFEAKPHANLNAYNIKPVEIQPADIAGVWSWRTRAKKASTPGA